MLLAAVKQYVSRVQQLTEMTIFTISYRWFSGTTQSNSDMPGPPFCQSQVYPEQRTSNLTN